MADIDDRLERIAVFAKSIGVHPYHTSQRDEPAEVLKGVPVGDVSYYTMEFLFQDG